MEKWYEHKYREIEKSHPWFVSRRKHILALLSSLPKTAAILDVGCSGGMLLEAFREKGYSNLSGVDISPENVRTCHEKGFANVLLMDARILSFPPQSIDVIIASDILEHLDDDEAALTSWRRTLTPKGIILCYVPAFPLLWSNHDVINHHARRYTKGRLRCACRVAGLLVEKLDFQFCLLFIPALFMKWFTTKQKDHFAPLGPFASSFISTALLAERLISNFVPLPFGTSLFFVAHPQEILANDNSHECNTCLRNILPQ